MAGRFGSSRRMWIGLERHAFVRRGSREGGRFLGRGEERRVDSLVVRDGGGCEVDVVRGSVRGFSGDSSWDRPNQSGKQGT